MTVVRVGRLLVVGATIYACLGAAIALIVRDRDWGVWFVPQFLALKYVALGIFGLGCVLMLGGSIRSHRGQK